MFSGLSFIQAGFLAAGMAVAVPVLIHLLFRQRARNVSIGSVRFLHQVVREHRRRRRVRQWLLLALRCLAVLLLALLFARPYLDASIRRGLEEELVLLVDRSASMQAQSAAGTPLQRALDAAGRELARVDENVVVHIAVFDAGGVEGIDVDQLKSAAHANASQLGTDYGLAVSWARDVLAASQRPRHRVILISDLQQAGLARTHSEPLDAATQFEIIDVGHAVSRNLAIVSVDAVQTEIRPKESVTLRISLRNFAPLPVADVPVQIRLTGPGGPIAADRRVDLPSGLTTIEIPLDIQEDGVYQGRVLLLQDDGQQFDNERWLAVEARRPDRILLVDGQQGRTVYGNETYYLETALRLRSAEAVADRRSFEVERIVWESGAGFPNLSGFRAIILTNLRLLSTTDVSRLAAYARGGGSVLIFAGDQTNPAHLDALRDAGVFPGTVHRRPATDYRRMTQWNKEHPALGLFADPQRGDLRRIQFQRILPIEELAADSQVLMQCGPLVLAAERTVEKGRCIYFGSTVDRAWTDWPQTRLYLPLVRQLTAYATGQFGARAQVATKLVEKTGETAGITNVGEQLIVRNIEPQESTPDRVTEQQLLDSLGITPAPLDPVEKARRASLALPEDAQRPDEIWTRILWILLAILLVETLLASRIHA